MIGDLEHFLNRLNGRPWGVEYFTAEIMEPVREETTRAREKGRGTGRARKVRARTEIGGFRERIDIEEVEEER